MGLPHRVTGATAAVNVGTRIASSPRAVSATEKRGSASRSMIVGVVEDAST
jgi:hypothetical protein